MATANTGTTYRGENGLDMGGYCSSHILTHIFTLNSESETNTLDMDTNTDFSGYEHGADWIQIGY